MQKITCLLFLALTVVSGLKFKANVNVSISANTDGSWKYRDTGLNAVGGPGFDVVYYTSRSVNRDKESRTWNVSGLIGAGLFLEQFVPFSFVGAYEADRQFGGGNGAGSGAGFQQMNFADSLAYIATAYVRLEERSSNGSLVDVQSLRFNRNFVWSIDAQYKDGVLASTSVVGRPSSGSWNVNITFVSSSIVGVLDLANAVVGPSSFEQILQINNYPYQSTQNHLTLVMVTATGSATTSSDGFITSIVSGSGSNKVYFTAATSAVVNGNTASVNVQTSAQATVDSDLTSDTFFLQQVASKYSQVSFTKVTVDFPAGASSIAYDPSVGAGQPVSGGSASSPASSVVASSFAVVLFSLLAALLL